MLKRRSLHAQVLDELGLRIVGDELPPGTRFAPEGELAGDMGISRTVAREVLKGLAARGMVTAKPRLGTRVTERTEWQLFDEDVMRWRLAQPDRLDALVQLMELRLLVEPMAARMTAERGEDEVRIRVRTAFDELEAAQSDPSGWVEAAVELHGAILSGCGNDFIASLARSLHTAIVISRNTTRPLLDHVPAEAVAHGHGTAVDEALYRYRTLAEAVCNGDGSKSEQACRGLLTRAHALLEFARGQR